MSPYFVWLSLFALLLLTSIFVGKDGGRRHVIAMALAGALVTIVLVNRVTGAAGYYPNTHALRLVKGMEQQLHRILADERVERIVLLEGSSYSARGLDGAMLGRLLSRRTGVRTAVLQMTLDGANHFERSWILEHVLDRLDREQERRLREVELTLLMEIQRGYDYSPLNGFMRNLGTSRAYAYMEPRNAVDGLRALESVGPLAPEPLHEVLPRATSHMLVNAMSVGMAYRGVTLDGIKPIAGYQPLRKKKRRYHYDGGMVEVLRQARLLVRGELKAQPRPLAWLDDIRLARYRRLLDGFVDREGHYAVPSTETADLLYAEAFCADRPGVICLRYADPKLLKRLDRKADWNDARHMRVTGAEKFTRWFARRYLRDVSRNESR